MNEISERLLRAIKQASGRGFDCYTVTTSRGDYMCPHKVTYHPKDGHGLEDEKRWLYFEKDGTATFDDEVENLDPIEALCQLFESLPEIKDRELIGK